jgi:SH3 domain protein
LGAERAIRRTVGAVGIALLLASAAGAEPGWVGRDVEIWVRSGPSFKNRNLKQIKSGDRVEIVQPGKEWTRVRLADSTTGWIPAGYLRAAPPPVVRVAELEADATELRKNLDGATLEVSSLRQSNDELTARDDEQRAEVERLDLENRNLKAGARWPTLIAGASILAMGMVVGWSLSRANTRRSTRRIRL